MGIEVLLLLRCFILVIYIDRLEHGYCTPPSAVDRVSSRFVRQDSDFSYSLLSRLGCGGWPHAPVEQFNYDFSRRSSIKGSVVCKICSRQCEQLFAVLSGPFIYVEASSCRSLAVSSAP